MWNVEQYLHSLFHHQGCSADWKYWCFKQVGSSTRQGEYLGEQHDWTTTIYLSMTTSDFHVIYVKIPRSYLVISKFYQHSNYPQRFPFWLHLWLTTASYCNKGSQSIFIKMCSCWLWDVVFQIFFIISLITLARMKLEWGSRDQNHYLEYIILYQVTYFKI